MKKVALVGIIASLLFAAIFLNSTLTHLDKPLADDPDLFSMYFILENNLSKLSKLDFTKLFYSRMFFPKQLTLSYYGDNLIPQSLIALPFYLITKDPLLSANLMVILTLILSFLSMFALAFYYTKNYAASIIAGLIFTYNPYILRANFPSEFNLLAVQTLPLIFLISEKLIRKITWTASFTLLSLFLLTLLASIYYLFFMSIIWPIFMLLRLSLEKISLKKFLHPAVFSSILIFILISIFYAQGYINSKDLDFAKRSIENNIYHSARLIDFIGNKQRGVFMGFVVYLLISVSLFLLFKNKLERKVAAVYFLISFLAIIFSFGPYLIIGDLKIPLPYLILYKYVPFYSGMRDPARFIIMAFLSVSVLSAFVINYLKQFKVFPAVVGVLCLILIWEYHTVPTLPYIINPQVSQFTSWLNSQDQIKVIVELPIANSFLSHPIISRDFPKDSIYLLYGLYHQKYLVNGYRAFIPKEAYFLGDLLSLNFPAPSKIDLLNTKGVNLIIVNMDLFKDKKEGIRIVEGLEKMNLKKVYNSENIKAFAI